MEVFNLMTNQNKPYGKVASGKRNSKKRYVTYRKTNKRKASGELAGSLWTAIYSRKLVSPPGGISGVKTEMNFKSLAFPTRVAWMLPRGLT